MRFFWQAVFILILSVIAFFIGATITDSLTEARSIDTEFTCKPGSTYTAKECP